MLYPKPASRKFIKQSRKVKSSSTSVVRAQRRSQFKPYASSTQGTNPQNAVVFRGIGFPDRLTTNLVYTESIVLTPSAGSTCPFVVYKATSGYDPNNAIGGGQPTYFDQIATIYDRYVVNGCKMTAMFSLPSTEAANIGPYICGINQSDLTTLPSTNAGLLMSAPNTNFKVVTGQDGTQTVIATYSRHKVYPLNNDNLQARVNSDPAQNWYFKPFASPQGLTVTTAINVVIVMEFNATFSDLKQLVDA